MFTDCLGALSQASNPGLASPVSMARFVALKVQKMAYILQKSCICFGYVT